MVAFLKFVGWFVFCALLSFDVRNYRRVAKGRQGNHPRHQRRGRRRHGRARLREDARLNSPNFRPAPSAVAADDDLRKTFCRTRPARRAGAADARRPRTSRTPSQRPQHAVTLLGRGVVPIINENDAVSFTEIKFGDNDKLSALVAALLPADLLVILTTVDGVIENFGKANPKTIPLIEQIDPGLEKIARGTDSDTAVGGMASKIQAAKIVVRSGIPLVIASGKKKDVLAKILAGETEGTLFVAQPNKMHSRKRWIAFFHHPQGALFVDDGAKLALQKRARASCRRAWRAARATSPTATWCGFAIWTGRNLPAASRGSIPPPCTPANCPRKNSCIGMIW